MIPVARTTDLITTEHPDGLVVYDTVDHRAHSLNTVSSFVWLESDGVNTVEDISRHLGVKLDRRTDQDEMRALVLMALSQLRKNGLLHRDARRPVDGAVPDAMSRRAAAAAIGKAAILVGGILPTVFSLVTPEPAFAMSPAAVTGECTTLSGGACSQNTCTGKCTNPDHLICECG